MISRTAIPVLVAAAALSAVAAPAASVGSSSSVERSSQNADTSYKLVLSQIRDNGEGVPMREMIVSFPIVAVNSNALTNAKREKITAGCVVM